MPENFGKDEFGDKLAKRLNREFGGKTSDSTVKEALSKIESFSAVLDQIMGNYEKLEPSVTKTAKKAARLSWVVTGLAIPILDPLTVHRVTRQARANEKVSNVPCVGFSAKSSLDMP